MTCEGKCVVYRRRHRSHFNSTQNNRDRTKLSCKRKCVVYCHRHPSNQQLKSLSLPLVKGVEQLPKIYNEFPFVGISEGARFGTDAGYTGLIYCIVTCEHRSVLSQLLAFQPSKLSACSIKKVSVM